MTKKLFWANPYDTHFEAEIIGIDEDGIILDRTLFYPDGGNQISDKGVTIKKTTAIDRSENQDVYCSGKTRTIPCETVVLAVGTKPEDKLYQSLKGRVKEIYRIGDCQNVGKIHDAVWKGFTLGRNL